jgi:hypothetical protein
LAAKEVYRVLGDTASAFGAGSVDDVDLDTSVIDELSATDFTLNPNLAQPIIAPNFSYPGAVSSAPFVASSSSSSIPTSLASGLSTGELVGIAVAAGVLLLMLSEK